MTTDQIISYRLKKNKFGFIKRRQKNSNFSHKLEYDEEFFDQERENSLKSAKVVVPYLISLLNPRSVVDVGCGAGAFLNQFISNGVNDVLGIDGTIANSDQLLVERDRIMNCDLTKSLSLDKKYDLVLSLEVAEHLHKDYSDTFISNLTNAGDIVVFSAAIPGQGGTHHVNEQWPSYWSKKFEDRGYSFIDCIRPNLWVNEEIDPIYAQNTILYVKKELLEVLPKNANSKKFSSDYPVPIVHPSIFNLKMSKTPSKNRTMNYAANFVNLLLRKIFHEKSEV